MVFEQQREKQNGDDSFEVPAPASFLVSRDGVVRNVYLEGEYQQRLEPETALEWIARL
jgi:peroxiredoxin